MARVGQANRIAALPIVLALVLLAAYLTLVGGSWFGIHDARLRVITLALAIGVLGVWIAAAVRDPAWRPRSAIWPAIAASLGGLAVSLVASRQPRLGMDYLAYAVLLAGMYLLLQRLMAHPFFGPRVAGVALPLFLTISVLYVGLAIRDWIDFWGLVGSVSELPLRPSFAALSFGNPSAVLTIATLLLATGLAVIGAATAGQRVVAIALVALLLAVALISGSRAGLLGLAVGAAVVVVAWLVIPRNRSAVRRVLGSRRVRMAVGAVVLVGLAGAVVLGPGILGRLFRGGEELRANFYRTSLRMFESSPLTGTGPGTWAPLRPSFTATGDTDYIIPHAHSLYFQTIAELGLVGLVAGVIVVVCLGWLIRGAILDADPLRRRFGWAALFATAYFGAHQLLDFYPNMPAALFAYALPIAFLDATARRPIIPVPSARLGISGRRRLPAIAAVAGIAALALASVWLVRSESAALDMARGTDLANEGSWAEARSAFAAAAAADPDLPPYQMALGIAAANGGDLETAAQAFERVIRVDDLPVAWLDLAAVRQLQGDSAGAGEALSRALRLGRQQAIVILGAGSLDLAAGDRAGAVDAFATVVTSMPLLAGDPWWTATPARSAVWLETFDTAMARAAPETGFVLAMSAGRFDVAASKLDQITDAGRRTRLALVLRAWQGDLAANADLQAGATASPLDRDLVGWCALVAAANGDEASAVKYQQWAQVLSEGPIFGIQPIHIRDGPAAMPDDVEFPAVEGLFWGHYAYRRPTPWDQLIGNLPHLVVD